MAHPQSSPRGLFAKKRIDVATQQLTDDGTNLVLNNGIKISNARAITADGNGYTLAAESALPGNVDGGNQFTLISNSTGVALAVNTSGTTWQYLSTTSKQPTVS